MDKNNWYQSAQSDWELIMATETDRTFSEIEYDGMGFAFAIDAKTVAQRMVKDLVMGLILKPTGSTKWLKKVEKEFYVVYEMSKDYIAQNVLKGIVPKVYTIENLIN